MSLPVTVEIHLRDRRSKIAVCSVPVTQDQFTDDWSEATCKACVSAYVAQQHPPARRAVA